MTAEGQKKERDPDNCAEPKKSDTRGFVNVDITSEIGFEMNRESNWWLIWHEG